MVQSWSCAFCSSSSCLAKRVTGLGPFHNYSSTAEDLQHAAIAYRLWQIVSGNSLYMTLLFLLISDPQVGHPEARRSSPSTWLATVLRLIVTLCSASNYSRREELARFEGPGPETAQVDQEPTKTARRALPQPSAFNESPHICPSSNVHAKMTALPH